MARTSTKERSRAIALAQESALAQQTRPSSALAALLEGRQRPLTRRERRLADETYYRLGSAHGTVLLHEFAAQALGQMVVQTQRGYVQTVRELNAVKNSVYLDEETARDVAEFTAPLKEMTRRLYAANLEAAAGCVLDLVARPLYEDEEESRGFLARLFRG